MNRVSARCNAKLALSVEGRGVNSLLPSTDSGRQTKNKPDTGMEAEAWRLWRLRRSMCVVRGEAPVRRCNIAKLARTTGDAVHRIVATRHRQILPCNALDTICIFVGPGDL